MRKTALDCVYELAQKESKVLFIGSDLGPEVLINMKKELPERFFMEGISEQHIIGMAAGLAMEGFIPYVNTIATFLTRRCYEQIVLDVCLQNLPVRFIANGGGAVYAPLGPTHLAVEDFAILRVLPNMTVVAVCDAIEMKQLMQASLNWPHPLYIRLAKGGDEVISNENEPFKIGKAILKKNPGDYLFVSTGVMTQIALKASKTLENDNIECGVLHMHTIKPLDKESILELFPKVKKIITVEEHFKVGGLGSSILEYCNEEIPDICSKIFRVGIADKFASQYGSQNSLLDHWGISVQQLCALVRNIYER